jgi:hypothetical protein
MAARFSLTSSSSEVVKVEPDACFAEAPFSRQHEKLVRPFQAVMSTAIPIEPQLTSHLL